MAGLSSNAELNTLIGSLIQTKQGRAKIAAAIGPELRRRRDYLAVGRKAFHVDELPPGTNAIYDFDVDVRGWLISEEGQAPEEQQRPKRVLVKTQEIVSRPKVSFAQIRERRYDIVNRVIEKAKAEVLLQEDGKIFSLMQQAGEGSNVDNEYYNAPIAMNGPLSQASLASALGEIVRHDIPQGFIFVNPQRQVDFTTWTDSTFDRQTQREVLTSGVLGYVYNMAVIQSRLVPLDKVWVTAVKEFTGIMPEKQALTTLSSDTVTDLSVGFVVFEEVGFYLWNSAAVVELTWATGAAGVGNIPWDTTGQKYSTLPAGGRE